MFKKKLFLLTMLMCGCISLVACSEKKENDRTNEVTETTTQKPDNNPLNIKGYEHYGTENLINGKDVAMVGKISDGATMDEKPFNNIFVRKCNKDEVVVEYVICDDLELYETYIANLDTNTYEVNKDLKLGDDFSTYTERVADGTLCTHNYDDGSKIIKYNDELQEIYEIEVKAEDDILSGYKSADGNKMYYAKNGWLMLYNALEEEESVVEHNYNMYVKFVEGVITDESGNDHVAMTVFTGDLNTYKCIINVSTMKMEYLGGEENESLVMEKDIFMLNIQDEEKSYENYVVTGKNGNTFSYTPKNTLYMENVKILSNGDMCFDSFRDGKLNVAIYDLNTGEIKGKTTFEVPLEVTEEVGMNYAYLRQEPIYMNESKVLLSVGDNAHNILFYIWDLDKADEESEYDVVAYEVPEDVIVSYSDEVVVTDFRKAECSEEFKQLLEVANKLEEKYGLDIFIEKEVAKIMDVYGLIPLEEYDKVQVALEFLDEELSRYPDGFFEQFVYDVNKGIDIHICSDIMLIDKEADNLEEAGGLHNTDEKGNVVLAIDFTAELSEVKQTIHHEISHAIDKRIEYYMDTFEEKWNELNPGDVYMYTYTDYASQVYDLGLDKYVYDYLYMEDRGQESYYLDNYSLTYPTEDRARIFENIMNKDTWYPDYSEMPLIKAKLNFYAECIRETFDTTGWENVEWERYLIAN